MNSRGPRHHSSLLLHYLSLQFLMASALENREQKNTLNICLRPKIREQSPDLGVLFPLKAGRRQDPSSRVGMGCWQLRGCSAVPVIQSLILPGAEQPHVSVTAGRATCKALGSYLDFAQPQYTPDMVLLVSLHSLITCFHHCWLNSRQKGSQG